MLPSELVSGGDGWLTVGQVAERLGLRERTVVSLIVRGELKAFGKPLKVWERELVAYLERSRIRPGELRRPPT